MRVNCWAAIVAMVMLLAACGGPDAGRPQPSARPDRAVVASPIGVAAPQGASSVLPSAGPSSPGSGGAACARTAMPNPAVSPARTLGANDAREEARRALLRQQVATPRRGPVPDAAVPGAEACIHALEIQFALLMRGSGKKPDQATIESALRSAGLTEVATGSATTFAASTGAACVYGTVTPTGPEFAIGPVLAGRPCLP